MFNFGRACSRSVTRALVVLDGPLKMLTLILAAGRFGNSMRTLIASDREPRLDVFEIAEALGADVLDFLDVDKSPSPRVAAARRALGASAALACLGFLRKDGYD